MSFAKFNDFHQKILKRTNSQKINFLGKSCNGLRINQFKGTLMQN